jgi:hypothetical protein
MHHISGRGTLQLVCRELTPSYAPAIRLLPENRERLLALADLRHL